MTQVLLFPCGRKAAYKYHRIPARAETNPIIACHIAGPSSRPGLGLAALAQEAPALEAQSQAPMAALVSPLARALPLTLLGERAVVAA